MLNGRMNKIGVDVGGCGGLAGVEIEYYEQSTYIVWVHVASMRIAVLEGIMDWRWAAKYRND